MKKSADSRSRKPAKKDKKPSFFARLKKWFVNIITELKRVMWPDRKKLRQSTVTVLLIIGLSVVIILAFDTVINFIMRTTGIYSTKTPVETEETKPSETEETKPSETDADETEKNTAQLPSDASLPVYVAAQGIRVAFEG